MVILAALVCGLILEVVIRNFWGLVGLLLIGGLVQWIAPHAFDPAPPTTVLLATDLQDSMIDDGHGFALYGIQAKVDVTNPTAKPVTHVIVSCENGASHDEAVNIQPHSKATVSFFLPNSSTITSTPCEPDYR